MTKRRVIATIVLLGAALACRADDPPRGVITFGDPHVDSIITRDLTAYFSRRGGGPPGVSYEYLRSGPTITGIAYPKYYLWVRTSSSTGGVRVEGPARIALIDSVAEITHFFPYRAGAITPAELDSVFPAAVAASIRSLYWK